MTDAEPTHPMDDGAAAGEALDHALSVLRATREAVLSFDENFVPIKTIVENESGRLIASVPVATFFSHEHVLFVPEETEDALQLLVSPEQVEESIATDRWMAYHGESEHVRWASMWIDSAKHGPWVFDGDAMAIPNILAPHEASLVRELNQDRDALRRVCQRLHDVEPDEPLCVGVDQMGIDIRARFGVLRAAFAQRATDPDHAAKLIRRLIEG